MTAPRGRADRTVPTPNQSVTAAGGAPAPIVGSPATACAGDIHNAARGKTMDRIIEMESGTYGPQSVHPHNGYYAGDFSSVPFTQPDLRTMLSASRGTTGTASYDSRNDVSWV
jgi:hypothetical protein